MFTVAHVRMLTDESEIILNARKEIAELWNQKMPTLYQDLEKHAERRDKVMKFMDKYQMTPLSSKDRVDVSRSLGNYMDRLLLMLVPISKEAVPYLERILGLYLSNAIPLSVQTVQHLFARTSTYSEALSLFYTLRTSRIVMSTETYFAIIFCLQRLEEESWGKRYNVLVSKLTEQHNTDSTLLKLPEKALDFIMEGCENALMPENKPWLGKVLLEDSSIGRAESTDKNFDAEDEIWFQRYRNGELS